MSSSLFSAGHIVGGRYTVQALLAHRSWATTYSAIAAPNRELVLKIVAPEISARPETSEMIRRMHAAASVLGQRHVVAVLEGERDAESGSQVLVTALSAQPSLAHLVQVCPLNVDEMIVLVRNVGRLLDAAHAAGLVHLALKPSNVFVGPAPEYFVRLADFGAGALRAGAEPEERLALAGDWIAPEQAAAHDEERAGAPADIFTLALIAFFASTGRPLSRGGIDDAAPHASTSQRARDHGVSLPPAVDSVFARALARAPGDRFPTAAHFVDALASACGQQVTSAPAVAMAIAPATPPAPAPPNELAVTREPAPRARNRRPFAVAAALLAASSLAVVALVARGRVGTSPGPPLHAAATGRPPPPIASPPERSTPPDPVAPSKASPVEPPATASLARLLVVCEPQCDRVLLNGKPMKPYPAAASLAPGTYGIGVARRAYGGQYQMLKLRAGQEETVRFMLSPLHPGAATKLP